tara:strand:- start:27027 stop:27248 length:222 start_codon:yes stop_codon:yes gene_type:complete
MAADFRAKILYLTNRHKIYTYIFQFFLKSAIVFLRLSSRQTTRTIFFYFNPRFSLLHRFYHITFRNFSWLCFF